MKKRPHTERPRTLMRYLQVGHIITVSYTCSFTKQTPHYTNCCLSTTFQLSNYFIYLCYERQQIVVPCKFYIGKWPKIVNTGQNDTIFGVYNLGYMYTKRTYHKSPRMTFDDISDQIFHKMELLPMQTLLLVEAM